MMSNSYGRWQQTIKINASTLQAGAIAKKLSTRAQTYDNDFSRSWMVWERYTPRKGNDEDIVVELWALLGELAAPSDWEIDWSASKY